MVESMEPKIYMYMKALPENFLAPLLLPPPPFPGSTWWGLAFNGKALPLIDIGDIAGWMPLQLHLSEMYIYLIGKE